MNRRLLLILSTIMLANCGEVGMAINISREQPLSVRVNKQVDAVVLVINEQVDFSLNDVDAFNEYLPILNDLGSISFNQFSYSLDSVSDLESSIVIQQFVVDIINGPDTLSILNETGLSLSNREKALVPLDDQDIATVKEWLFDRDTISTNVLFELTDFPAGLDRIDFRFTAYFDATLKARNIPL